MKALLLKMIEGRMDEMIAIRRHLHQFPELSFAEVETAAYIKNFYAEKPVQIDTISERHGFVVTINPGKSERVLALRADFDALPMQELVESSFKSQHDGIMHACGHDLHTAALMIAADSLITLRDQLPITIKIIHQHAEETPPGGAVDFMNSGLLDDVTRIYGAHVMPDEKLGTIRYAKASMMAGNAAITVDITGLGGHGASPHLANDAIVAASQFVVASQSIVSRRIDPQKPAVITIGSFEGKGADNVIQEHVHLALSTRYFEESVEKCLESELEALCHGIAAMYKVEVQMNHLGGYPALVNHPEVVSKIIPVLKKAAFLDTVEEIEPVPFSEDFATYLKTIPGAFLFVGSSATPSPYFLHNPKFEADERVLIMLAQTMIELTIAYINEP